MTVPKPTLHGWEDVNGCLEMIPDSKQNQAKQASVYETVMKKCRCKKSQCKNGKCGCFHSKQNCSSFCECENCGNPHATDAPKKLMNMSQTVKLMMRVHQMRKIRSSLMTLILIELFNNCILIFNGRMGVSKIESTSSPIKHHYEVTTTSEDLIGCPHHPRGSCQHLCAQGAKPPDD
jgi:hypothetical protein